MLRNSPKFIYEFSSFLRMIVSFSLSLSSFSPLLFSIWRSITTADISRVQTFADRAAKDLTVTGESSFFTECRKHETLPWAQRKMVFEASEEESEIFFKVHNYRGVKCTPLKATKTITHIAEQEVQYLVDRLFLRDQFLTSDPCITSQGAPREPKVLANLHFLVLAVQKLQL